MSKAAASGSRRRQSTWAGPYSVSEGETLSLAASVKENLRGGALQYQWVVNGSNYQTTSSTATFSAAGIGAGAVRTARVRVHDGSYWSPWDEATIHVTNAAPTIP